EPAEPVAPGSSSYFLCASGNNALALYSISDPLGTPTFTGTHIPITPWQPAGDAPQPGGPPVLQQQAGFPLHKTCIRHSVIWPCQSPSATGLPGDRAGIVVYKVNAANGTLLSSYQISDPSLWYYLPAIVPDISGNAIVVFAGSDTSQYASIF